MTNMMDLAEAREKLIAISYNGEKWRIVPEDDDWEMLVTGHVTAGRAEAICRRIATADDALTAAQSEITTLRARVEEVEREREGLVSKAEVLRTLRALGDQDADLALYGATDNARAREYGEAAMARACCAVAIMATASDAEASLTAMTEERDALSHIAGAAMAERDQARAALAEAVAGEPVGWRYREKGARVWKYAEHLPVKHHPVWEIEPLHAAIRPRKETQP